MKLFWQTLCVFAGILLIVTTVLSGLGYAIVLLKALAIPKFIKASVAMGFILAIMGTAVFLCSETAKDQGEVR